LHPDAPAGNKQGLPALGIKGKMPSLRHKFIKKT
jgi:hypothetical protein